MVWLSDNTIVGYPFIFKYYKELLPLVAGKKTVFNAWVKNSTFENVGAATKALKYGSGPMIKFSSEGSMGCNFGLPGGYTYNEENSKNKPLLGVRWGNTPTVDLCIIMRELADAANKALFYLFSKDKRYEAGHRKIVEFFEVVTLHELIHWSYYSRYGQMGWEKEEKRWGGDAEGGTAKFETEAYGRPQDLDWHVVCKEKFDKPSLGLAGKYIETGWLIVEVPPYSWAERAGILPGDVLMMIGNTQIAREGDVGRALDRLKFGDEVTIVVRRLAAVVPLRVRFSADKQADAKARMGVE